MFSTFAGCWPPSTSAFCLILATLTFHFLPSTIITPPLNLELAHILGLYHHLSSSNIVWMASKKPTSNTHSLDPVNEGPHVRKATVYDLGSGKHFTLYARALERVMSTDVSQSTFAQLVDGAPLSQTLSLMPGRPELSHPVYKHSKLCDGVHEKVGRILDMSNLHVLQFDFDVSQSPTTNQGRGSDAYLAARLPVSGRLARVEGIQDWVNRINGCIHTSNSGVYLQARSGRWQPQSTTQGGQRRPDILLAQPV